MRRVQTPCYLIDEALLRKNLEILHRVMERTGCKILLAQKAFSMFSAYPLIARYLSGACASGLYEARLAHEHFPGENHIYSPAYREDEFEEILALCDHIVFNSVAQWRARPRGGQGVRSAHQSGMFHAGGACDLRSVRARFPTGRNAREY